MKKLSKLLNRINFPKLSFLQFLVWVYIFFIPFWPKLPLKTITYTYIAVRYEDLFMAFITLVFGLYLIFKKIELPKNPFNILIPLYWIVVIISALVGFYHYKSVESLQLILLHAFRRVEYMIVFFIGLSSIKNNKQLKFYLNSLMVMLFVISVYGIGQKFWGWPAIQTMNPHYSKGYLLTLDANARISSSFGGHYDFAAFLVFLMPLSLGLFLYFKKIRYFLVFTVSLIALILTASRASYVAYLLTVPLFILLLKRYKLLLVVIALTIILTPLSDTLTKRINRTFRQELVWVNNDSGRAIVPRKIIASDLPAGDYIIKNEGNKSLRQTDEQVSMIKNELKETIIREAEQSGKKLTESQIDRMVDEAFSTFKPISTVLPDISFATRLQVEWPRAIKAFLKNPLLGTGPGSITEATDNDYLRALGETGFLGFSLFFGVLLKLAWHFWQQGRKHKVYQGIFWGVLFGILALLINALYIDVFEASKVALMIWLVWGMIYKLNFLKKNEIK